MAIDLIDLERNDDLDAQAYKDVCGGWAGFLSGLFAPTPGGLLPNMTSNYFFDIDVTNNMYTMQQNPINLSIGAGNGSVVAIDSLNLTPVSAGSPMTWVQGTPPTP